MSRRRQHSGAPGPSIYPLFRGELAILFGQESRVGGMGMLTPTGAAARVGGPRRYAVDRKDGSKSSERARIQSTRDGPIREREKGTTSAISQGPCRAGNPERLVFGELSRNAQAAPDTSPGRYAGGVPPG
jgi:hypothetical protein